MTLASITNLAKLTIDMYRVEGIDKGLSDYVSCLQAA